MITQGTLLLLVEGRQPVLLEPNQSLGPSLFEGYHRLIMEVSPGISDVKIPARHSRYIASHDTTERELETES